jgi:hypothetical protein
VGFDDILGDGQTQSRPLSDAARNQKILVEDLGLIFFRNSTSCICHFESDEVIRRPGSDLDGAAGRRMSDSIGNEVGKNQFQTLRVGEDLLTIRRQVHGEDKSPLLRQETMLVQDIFHEGKDSDIDPLQLNLAGLNPDDVTPLRQR